MNLILLARYWKYIAIGVLAMLLVFTAYLLRQSHNTIDTLAANAAADANFRIEYSRTTGNLLVNCSKEYSSLAATTDRISNDLRAIQQSRK